MNKFQSFFIKLFTGIKGEEFQKTFQNANAYNDSAINCCNEMEEIYLFDFKNWQGDMLQNNPTNSIVIGGENSSDNSNSKIPTKIKIKPIDVLEELEVIPTPFNLTLIDEKISILKDKAKLIKQNYSRREVEGLIERLENRKKYNEFKEYFDQFPNTNDEKIDAILTKYDLLMKTSDIFIPEFPDVAVKTMTEYIEKVKLVCGKAPIFYVIADNDQFRKAYDKRDPILLVQSPFGFYWQILGAWDKEMILLSEL